MATVYGYSTFDNLFDQVMHELQEDEKLGKFSPDSAKQFILDGSRKIADNLPIREQRDLLLIQDQEDYLFSDSTVPATGTGTVNVLANAVTGVTATGTGTLSTDDTAVTGVGTLFSSELAVGKALIVTISGTAEIKEIASIESNTALTLRAAFSEDVDAGTAFDYSTTKFKDEIVVGSILVVNSETRTVKTVTDAYNVVVTAPFTTANAQTFTIDTVATEIPTKFKSIFMCDRLESSQRVPVQVVSLNQLLERRQDDATSGSYTNLNTPLCVAVWRNASGYNMLKVYPVAETNKTIRLYGNIRVNPKTFASTAITANVPLNQEFDQIVVEYVKWKVAHAFLKDKELAREFRIEFVDALREFGRNLPNTASISPVID